MKAVELPEFEIDSLVPVERGRPETGARASAGEVR